MAIDTTTDFGVRVHARLANEQIIWLTTVSADGTPQPNPVWFIWDGATVQLFTEPNVAKVVNIRRNPRVSLSFNSTPDGGDVVILTGDATIIDAMEPTLVDKYAEKYAAGIANLGLTRDSMLAQYSAIISVTPTKIRGF